MGRFLSINSRSVVVITIAELSKTSQLAKRVPLLLATLSTSVPDLDMTGNPSIMLEGFERKRLPPQSVICSDGL